MSFLQCRGEGDNLRRKQPKKQYNNSFTLAHGDCYISICYSVVIGVRLGVGAGLVAW